MAIGSIAVGQLSVKSYGRWYLLLLLARAPMLTMHHVALALSTRWGAETRGERPPSWRLSSVMTAFILESIALYPKLNCG